MNGITENNIIDIDNILAIISIIISIIALIMTLVQNKIIQNENKLLQVIPNLDIKLLVFLKIRGDIIKINDGIEEINVMKTKYSDFYIDRSIFFTNSTLPLFILSFTNNGNGLAKDVVIQKVIITKLNSVQEEYSDESAFFSCPVSETKACKIFSNIPINEVKEVRILIKYCDIINNKYEEDLCYVPIENNECAELKLLKL